VNSALCDKCGGVLYRSRSRSFVEKLIKLTTRYRTYRCHECNWRGWIVSKPAPMTQTRRRAIARAVFGFALAVAATISVLLIARIS
jgi:uncharacterized protein with PIN domain